ncbi:MAG TPA: HAD family hydrolase [Spirochaetes bacterium]|nr:HAD family hydrolase [Spirochaetota bacterium]
MGFELCIFDLDGTLVDTRADITAAANDMLAHYKLGAKSVDEVTGYVGDGISRLVERCLKDSGIELKRAVLIFLTAYKSRHLETTKPYPGVDELLKHLKDKYKAVLTNKSRTFSKSIMDALKLSAHFSIIVGGDTFKDRKPSPDGIEHIIKQSGIEKAKTVMIGDGKNDILTATNAGVASVFVTYGFSKDGSVVELNPDFVVDKPLDLVDICL